MPDEQPNGDGGMEDEAPVAAYPIPILGLDEATRQPVTATILVVVLSGGRGMRLVPDPPGLAPAEMEMYLHRAALQVEQIMAADRAKRAGPRIVAP